MNELLGWYGYGSVDRNELSAKTTSASSQQSSVSNNTDNNNRNNNNSKNNNTINLSRKSSPSTTSRLSMGIRGPSSTPERNSSPESSKSPTLKQMIDKQQGESFHTCNVLISFFFLIQFEKLIG